MPQMIFVNLPVQDLTKATAFYESIGFRKDPRFSDETASGMVLTDVIHVMLLTHEKFASFTPRPIADAKASTEVLLAISAESREGVDDMVAKATAAGGAADPGPQQDYGVMYGRSFEDPDGHIWEVVWMDLAAFLEASGQAQTA
ncbi:VOC family protein [Acuticoccus sp. M5D2P5]|uniref:VOC family protein n=1 Tax=Acuticoccus kalidii TaxID=2910977 RepID=UPI001F3A0809|nr:VOC family protein [Acuticoccus kalidii]MCF3933037.1 VOC family protein [Acuticoccus kalidii]